MSKMPGEYRALNLGRVSLKRQVNLTELGLSSVSESSEVKSVMRLPHATTHKIKADRSIGTLGKSARFYNVTTAKEYEVQSAPLTSDECLQVEQMLTSPVVRIPWGTDSNLAETDFDAMLPILITDFTSELSDTDDKPI